MKNIYTIKEYGSFCAKPGIPGHQYLPEPTFSQLEEFILSNQSADADALELMGLSARKGVGKIITAKNYVGIITMKDGTTIEPLMICRRCSMRSLFHNRFRQLLCLGNASCS